jgi:hypothetical protein
VSGDVKVFGLTPGTYVLSDIGMDVPQGVTVTIPGAKAYASKDLWRAISQKCVFHLSSGPSVAPGSPVKPNTEMEDLRGQLKALTDENARLREALAAKVSEAPLPSIVPAADSQVQAKLDDIMALLRAGGPLPAGYRPGVDSPVGNGLVSGETPTFIPSTIKPGDVDVVQISTTPEESNGAGIGGAASALRKLRKGAG